MNAHVLQALTRHLLIEEARAALALDRDPRAQTITIDDLRCTRCGNKVDGWAQAHVGDRHGHYCHPDNPRKPDCYTLSSWEGFPELREEEDVD